MYREWKFESGVEVYEKDFDYDLHILEVYSDGKYLGTIYPGSVEEMNSCFDDLDAGVDPIESHWEDGYGNTCTLEGWGLDD